MKTININLVNPDYAKLSEIENCDVVIMYFEKKVVIPIRDGFVQGEEIYYPESNEIWLHINGTYIQNTRDPNPSQNWDTSGIQLTKHDFPNELGEVVERQAYIYGLQRGDYDIYDLLNIMRENMHI